MSSDEADLNINAESIELTFDEEERLKELSKMSQGSIMQLAQNLEMELLELAHRESKELMRCKYLRVLSLEKRKHRTR